MSLNYIIVQAGGKGTRMESLTANKPKALVPIDNLPMIFHLFRKYPSKKFIIIGDYKYDVLDRYLKEFADVVKIPEPTLVPVQLNELVSMCKRFKKKGCLNPLSIKEEWVHL